MIIHLYSLNLQDDFDVNHSVDLKLKECLHVYVPIKHKYICLFQDIQIYIIYTYRDNMNILDYIFVVKHLNNY